MKKVLAPEKVSIFFMDANENLYNLRNKSDFRRHLTSIIYHSSESISYVCPNICDNIPEAFLLTTEKNQAENGYQKTIFTECVDHN